MAEHQSMPPFSEPRWGRVKWVDGGGKGWGVRWGRGTDGGAEKSIVYNNLKKVGKAQGSVAICVDLMF